MAIKYNDYSKKLLEFFPKGPLRFQVANTYFDRAMGKQVVPTSTLVKSFDRIFDPGHGREIDIAYITGTRPLGPNSPRDEEIQLGEITFSRGNFGMWEYDGNDAQRSLALYLFFSNCNGSNVGKPWYLGGTTLYNLLTNEGAAVKLKGELLIDKAKEKLASFTPEFVSQLAQAWFPQDFSRLDYETTMLRLREIAEKDPAKIIASENNPEVSTQAFVNSATKAGLIRCNDNNTAWEFKDGTPLVTIPGDETPYMAIRKFFSTEVGQKVRLVLEEDLAGVVK